jgi:hypothetical protein
MFEIICTCGSTNVQVFEYHRFDEWEGETIYGVRLKCRDCGHKEDLT